MHDPVDAKLFAIAPPPQLEPTDTEDKPAASQTGQVRFARGKHQLRLSTEAAEAAGSVVPVLITTRLATERPSRAEFVLDFEGKLNEDGWQIEGAVPLCARGRFKASLDDFDMGQIGLLAALQPPGGRLKRTGGGGSGLNSMGFASSSRNAS